MQNNKGFTLMEIMVTVAIATIVLTVLVPRSRDFQANMRVSAAASDLVSALKAARSEAVTSRRHVTFTQRPATTSWASGWQATVIENNATVVKVEQSGLPATINITPTPVLSQFRFEALTGLGQLAAGAGVLNITFQICDTGTNKETGRDVTVNQFGQITTRAHSSATVCNP